MTTNTNKHDQFERVIEPREGEVTPPDDGISPIMPFPTAYQLNRDQEKEIVDHCMIRIQQLEQESGRDLCAGGNWWSTSSGIAVHAPQGEVKPHETWMGKRTLYDKMFRNEMDWRPSLLGGIFAKTNLVVPAARRICRQMIARACSYFFGTSPWFAIYPVGQMDKIRSDQADRYTRWKMDQAKLQRVEEMAVRHAFILGEGVVKTGWAQKERIHRTLAKVLVDESGADILGADGDYIMEADTWVLDEAPDPQTGEIIPATLAILERDGVTPQPEQIIWQEKYIIRRIVHYRGPEAKNIHFTDFLCPLDAPSIQEADCCVHLYDMPIMILADQWMKALPVNATATERQEANRKAVEMLRLIGGAGTQKTSGQNSSDVDSSTGRKDGQNNTQPILHIAEVHISYDADGDGLLEDVIIVIDTDSRTPIFYDYVANVTPDGLRPFSVTRINDVSNRWYGLGAMEMFQTSQEIVDLWMNRKNFANSGAGRVTFWDSSKTLEGKARPGLQINGGETFTLNTGAKAEDALSVIYLDDNKSDDLQAMIEFFLQLMMNESGIANANDGNVSGMDSTKLATGIRNIEKSGQELFGLYIGDLEPGISESLSKMVKILFANMDQMEVYRYFEAGQAGGEGVQGMQQINPGDLANLEIDTQILLTRRRGEQVIESNTRIVELIEKFYSFPFQIQQVVVQKFIDMAKEFQCADADKMFIPTEVLLVGPTGAMSPAGPANPPRQSSALL